MRGVTPQSAEQPFTLRQMAPTKRRWWIPYVIAGLVLALAGGGYALTRDDPIHGSVSACQDAVRRELKTPSTARFSEDRIVEQSRATFYVRGVVDAENSFGAPLRNRYECIVNQSGQSWQVADVSLLAWP